MEELTDKVERRVKRSKEIGANIEENLFKQLQSYHNFSKGFIWKLLGLLLDTNSRKQNMFNSFKDLIQNKKQKCFSEVSSWKLIWENLTEIMKANK